MSDGRRVRGLMHAHSTFSFDGRNRLEEVRDGARHRGLRFLVQTEHSNEMTREAFEEYVARAGELSGPEFLLLPGMEYASADNRIHVLVVGVDRFHDDLRLFPDARGVELLDRVRGAGGLSILAHPERSDAIASLPEGFLDRVDGIEVWNGKTDRIGPSPRALEAVAAYREKGRPKIATAGLDLHAVSDFAPVGLELEGLPRDGAALVEAVREGRFRLFFGPLRWDAVRAGRAARWTGYASRWAVARGRRLKAGLLSLGRPG